MDRRFPIVEFDASKFSGFFGAEVDSLEAELLSGGACNSNYLVRSEGEKFVCRIHQRGSPQVESRIQGFTKGVVPSPEYLWVGNGVLVMGFIEDSLQSLRSTDCCWGS